MFDVKVKGPYVVANQLIPDSYLVFFKAESGDYLPIGIIYDDRTGLLGLYDGDCLIPMRSCFLAESGRLELAGYQRTIEDATKWVLYYFVNMNTEYTITDVRDICVMRKINVNIEGV